MQMRVLLRLKIVILWTEAAWTFYSEQIYVCKRIFLFTEGMHIVFYMLTT